MFGNVCLNSLKKCYLCLLFRRHFCIWYRMIAWRILWLQIHLNKDCILFCWKVAFTFDDTSFVHYVLWKVQWSVFWNIWKPEFWYQFHFPKHWTFYHIEKVEKEKDIKGMIFILKYESNNFLHVWNQIQSFHLLKVKFEWFFTTK